MFMVQQHKIIIHFHSIKKTFPQYFLSLVSESWRLENKVLPFRRYKVREASREAE